jgi:hypothetical protein
MEKTTVSVYGWIAITIVIILCVLGWISSYSNDVGNLTSDVIIRYEEDAGVANATYHITVEESIYGEVTLSKTESKAHVPDDETKNNVIDYSVKATLDGYEIDNVKIIYSSVINENGSLRKETITDVLNLEKTPDEKSANGSFNMPSSDVKFVVTYKYAD